MRQQTLFALASLAILVTACAAPSTGTTAPMDYNVLLEDLRQAGAQVEPAGPVEQSFFSVGGRFLRVDGQDIQVFEYPDVASRQAESDQISSDGSTIGTTMVTWVDQPSFWAQDLLIVLYVGQDEATIGALSSILGEPLTGA